ncbi:hypothetical protein BDZ97DRAFT_1101656 [Flammula alnicola]|nr:hypothetical protein BDZ97DRAFT_1101656 [Flammula alnicola]
MSTYYLHDIGEGELSSFFQLTPYLTKLSIYLPSRTDVLNMVYYPGSSTPPLLPNLEELYLFVYESVAGTDTDQSSSSIMSGKCRRLQHMRIVLPGAVLCNYAQELLEGHASIDELDEMEKERLRILKDWSGIVNCMPDTFSYFELTSPPKIPLKIRRALQISHFFSAIEGVQVESVRELYQSDIHHLMYHVHNLSSSDIPGENRYNFRKRAKGTHSIVYVRKDDAIRKSPDVLEFLIFGQNFNPEKYATTWHDLQQLLRFLD